MVESNEQPVVTPPTEPVEPQKVTFTPEQKDRINEIVKNASARAGIEARAETERLRKLIPANPTEPQSTDTATLLRLAQAESELSTLKAQAQESALSEVLHKAANTQPWFDPTIAESILRNSVRVVEGVARVYDASGAVRLNSSFEPMSPAEAAAELAESKKFLVRSEMHFGSGSVMNTHHEEPGPKLETIFGRNSDGGAANRLAMKSPKTYAAMKVRARAAGLIP